MVDALQIERSHVRAVASDLHAHVEPLSSSGYAEFCARASHAPHQSPRFLGAWADATGSKIFVVSVARDGRDILKLPLEIVTKGPFRQARFPGGQHANGNQAPSLPAEYTAADLSASIVAAIRSAIPGADLLALERLAPAVGGTPNPLAAMTTGTSPNVALSVHLDGGFEALLDRSSGKRKRKKHRSQLRKFEAAGGFRLIRPDRPGDTDLLLDAFFTMKAERFAQMGIPNVFAEPGCVAFMRNLYREGRPDFILHGLEIGGKLRAVTGSSLCGDRMICDISAIASDELTGTSPGDFLFHEMIREACERGLAVFDFSVGDEHYKRLWCDTETWQSDVFMPLTARGAAAVTVARSIAAMKRAIKSNPLVWSLAKRQRKNVAGRDSVAPAEDQD